MIGLKLLCSCFFMLHVTKACTEFFMKTEDESVVIGRTMDFDDELRSNVLFIPKETARESALPSFCGQAPPLKWTYKYDALCLNAFNQSVCPDGMNSEGLSVGSLLLPQYTVYDNVTRKDCSNMISDMQLPSFLLGSYKSIQHIRNDINTNKFPKVFDASLLSNHYKIHFTITDSSGDALVLEFTKDGRKAHDNIVGVTTNAPPYDFHMMNIKNYVHLSKFSAGSFNAGDVTFTSVGSGGGIHGIPGDFSPTSRFIRTTYLLHFSNKPKTTKEGVVLASHLLHSVDVPKGVVQDGTPPKEGTFDYTQWVVIKDLKNLILYLRYYDDLSFRQFDMKEFQRRESRSSHGRRGVIPDDTRNEAVVF